VKVCVCVWEPSHTLERIEKQRSALQDGTIEGLVKKHGAGTPELAKAMEDLGLLSRKDTDRGAVCAVCDSLMDEVLSRPGIKDRIEAFRDVAQDFGAAVDRTRAARA
jgi:hypothetical protein